MTPLLVAFALEFLLGEPPTAVHPVVWMGRFLGFCGKRLPSDAVGAFLGGALSWLLGAFVCFFGGVVVVRAIGSMGWAGGLLEGALLWPLFSIRMLFSEVKGVEDGLAVSLEEGRARLSRIVSRDTSDLTATQVRESALESLSENLSDSVIAPLFWWAVLGLPGAFLYRFANTADASWGYRGEWEHKGKWAAKADDVLNWIPARLTALFLGGFRHRRALFVEASRTPSPNGGWPMAALALALGIRLGKPHVYTLNESGVEPTSDHVRRAFQICSVAIAVGAVATIVLRGFGCRW